MSGESEKTLRETFDEAKVSFHLSVLGYPAEEEETRPVHPLPG
jgi:hypothetical protein